FYNGTRKTDSRYALLARVNQGICQPFLLNAHLSTLIGERGGPGREIPGKGEEARAIRQAQSKALISLVEKHILQKDKLVFLLADFNAIETEACISNTLLKKDVGFVRLVPEKEKATHPLKVPEKPVDHILVFPGDRTVEYKCWIPE